MKALAQPVLDRFIENLASVERLVGFDRSVLDFSIQGLRALQARLEGFSKNQRHHVTAMVGQLEKIREHDSMRPLYQEMFNQCVVLQVSYFGSAMSDLFRACVPSALASDRPLKAFDEDLKLTLRELRDFGSGSGEAIGDLIIRKQDISFQDMQSIVRALRDYLELEVPRDVRMNNIVCGQGCRHAIVHSGSLADARLASQLRHASPRELKPTIVVGERLQFSPQEVSLLSESMKGYFQQLIARLPAGGDAAGTS